MDHLHQGILMRQGAFRARVYLAIPVGLAGGLLLVNMLNIAFHERLFLPGWIIPALFIVVLGVVAMLLIYYLSRGSLHIYRTAPGELQMDAQFPNGENYTATGKWYCTTTYIKVYARYGMYTKYVAVCLYCNDQPFMLLRHQIGGMGAVPDDFVEVSQLTNPGVPEIWSKSALRVAEIIRSK